MYIRLMAPKKHGSILGLATLRNPSIRDGVHRTETFLGDNSSFFNFFSTFSKKKKKNH